MSLPKLSKPKRLIQNIVIIVAMIYVFGTAGTAYFSPGTIEDSDGKLSEFQQLTLDNSSILIVVIISGAIGAIALDRSNSENTELIDKLIDKLHGNAPSAI